MKNTVKFNDFNFYYDDLKTPIVINKNKDTILFLDEDYYNVLLKIKMINNELTFIITDHINLQKLKISKLSKLEYKIFSN